MDYAIFAIIWVVTFWPSWYLLLKLIAISTAEKLHSFEFAVVFLVYRLLIALPYLYLVIVGGESINGVVRSFAIALLGFGLIVSVMRFFFSKYVNAALWYIYGYVYDGLQFFYPYSKLQESIFNVAGPQKNQIILDLGAGSGNQTVLLANKAANVVAVDSSKSMLARLRKKINKRGIGNVEVIESDVMAYLRTEKSSRFDAIVLVNVLYTVENRSDFWPELLRILKPKGKIVITNSDKGGNGSLIKEHTANRGFLSLLRPSLVGVFVVDSLISEMAKTGHFSFAEEKLLKKEIESAGGKYRFIERCYGDVNILFEITK